MAAQLLFYDLAVPVSPKAHRDLYVKSGDSFGFARHVNSVPLTAIEFAQAAAEYPIVFAGTENSVMPAVVLGAGQKENLFIDEAGHWLGNYIPAFVRRYPFVFSSDKDGKTFVLHLDETFEGCNREGRGERLFDSDGEKTQFLNGILKFLQDYQARFQRTKVYCERLMELKLLQPMQAQFNLQGGDQRSLSGFMTIDREKLKSVPASSLEVMFRNEELECTYLHLHSLRHFRSMLERFPVAQQEAAGDAEGEQRLPDPHKAARGRSRQQATADS